MKLLDDVLSVFKGKVYARKGEIVGIITQHGNVLVVEDEKGERFPVHESKLPIIELGEKK